MESEMLVDIWTTEGVRVHSAVTPEFANAFMELPEGDVEWAIEEHGRCDTIGLIAVPRGSEKPTPGWAQ